MLSTYHQFWRVILLGFSFFVLLNVHGQIDLKIRGDIESNSGQNYVVNKVIQSSFHQGNQRFGKTTGIQCACDSLYAICWSKVKKVFVWNTSDLGHILIQGDLLYKSLEKNDLLSVDDLAKSVEIHDYHVPLAFLMLETKIATLRAGYPFP